MEDCTEQNLAQRSTTPTGFFRVPGLFVRLSSNGLNAVDPDSVWSPKSPLDIKNLLSNIGSTNLKCAPRVGLGLVVDALTAGESSFHVGGKSSFLESIRPFLELAQVSTNLKTTGSVGVTLNGVADADFARSEEYTCVIEHGPNPRTTHILGGHTLEVPPKGVPGGSSKRPVFTVEPIGEQPWPSTAAGVASGLCSYCRKRLRQDRDVYMYLGEKAFCSNECRKGCIEEVELMMLDSGSSEAVLS